MELPQNLKMIYIFRGNIKKKLSWTMIGLFALCFIFSINKAIQYGDYHQKINHRLSCKAQGEKADAWKKRQQDRVNKIRRECFALSNVSSNTADSFSSTRIWHIKKYDIGFCKINKCASTFMKQMYLLLNERNSIENLLGASRDNIQISGLTLFRELSRKNNSKSPINSTLLIVVRNPYSRLYSAFVDKVYLPFKPEKYGSIIVKELEKTHVQNVTFEDFLRFVVLNRNPGKQNLHWKSIYHSCAPCIVHYNIIVKQETFEEDMEYIFKKLKIAEKVRSALFLDLRENHSSNTVKELTADLVHYAERRETRKYFQHSFIEFCRRLWNSYCIQGNIRKSLPFPEERFARLNYTSVDKIVSVFLEYVNRSRMTHEERILQRNDFLRNAYKGISRKIIKDLQEIYHFDFKLFGYSLNPPR